MYGYSRNTPQYRAHDALDTVLKSYYGGAGSRHGGEGMGMAATHRLQDAYSHLLETMSHAKERIFGGATGESGGGGFADYLKGGSRRGGWYGEEEDRGLLSNIGEKLKYYTGSSDVRLNSTEAH